MGNDLVRRREPITGPEHLVRATLATQYWQGRLLTPPDRIILVPGPDGQVVTVVDLLMDKPAPWRKRNPLAFGSLVAVAITAALFGAGWLLVRAVAHALAGANGPAALGVLAIAGAVLLMFLAGRVNHRGACPGIAVHCKGCRR